MEYRPWREMDREPWLCPHPNCHTTVQYGQRGRHQLLHSGPIICQACEETIPHQAKLEYHQRLCSGPGPLPNGFPNGTKRTNNGNVMLQVEYVRYIQKRVMTARATAASRIVNDFSGIYNCLDNTHDIPFDYDAFLAVPHPRHQVPLITHESLRYCDLHGEGPTYDVAGNGRNFFMQDPSVDFCLQARRCEFCGSGLERIHYAAAANHRKNLEHLSKTYLFTNVGVGPRAMNNGPVQMAEEFCRERIREVPKDREAGSGLIMTFSEFGEWVESVKPNELNSAGVPRAIGKININRYPQGLELWSWRFEHEANAHSPLCEFEWDPYDLMENAGLTLSAPRSIFRKINGVIQPNWIDNPTVFPLIPVTIQAPVAAQE